MKQDRRTELKTEAFLSTRQQFDKMVDKMNSDETHTARLGRAA